MQNPNLLFIALILLFQKAQLELGWEVLDENWVRWESMHLYQANTYF